MYQYKKRQGYFAISEGIVQNTQIDYKEAEKRAKDFLKKRLYDME